MNIIDKNTDLISKMLYGNNKDIVYVSMSDANTYQDFYKIDE